MAEVLKSLASLCAEVGVVLGELSPELQARLALLAKHTLTVSDGRRIAALSRAIFEHYEAHAPERRFSPLEQRIVVIGSLFADIGKTGPLHADGAQQELIVEMFSVEGVRDDKQPVSRFLSTHFPRDAAERVRRFAALGLDPSMSMRSFWNLHAGWTLEIAKDSGLPPEAIAAAATHHLLEDVNPQSIVGEDGRYSIDFGENLEFDRAEKLVILLDKYDALMRRARRTHEQAIAWLRDLLAGHPRFRDDAELTTLLDDLDHVGKTQAQA